MFFGKKTPGPQDLEGVLAQVKTAFTAQLQSHLLAGDIAKDYIFQTIMGAYPNQKPYVYGQLTYAVHLQKKGTPIALKEDTLYIDKGSLEKLAKALLTHFQKQEILGVNGYDEEQKVAYIRKHASADGIIYTDQFLILQGICFVDDGQKE